MKKPSKWMAALALLAAALLGAAPAFAHGRVHFGIGLNFGPYWGPYWGPGWYYPPPYYYYPPPVVIAPAQPQTYVERNDQVPQQSQPQPGYWYYCQASRAYYPYVKECPGGWQAVSPTPSPSQ